MKLALRHKIPAVVGTAVLLAGAGGAVAFAVSGHGPTSTQIGNTLPIDDNHRVGDRGTQVEPGAVSSGSGGGSDDGGGHDAGDDSGSGGHGSDD